MMGLVVALLLLIVSVITLLYAFKHRSPLDTELKIAKFVSELGQVEAEYWSMANRGRFLNYPNIAKQISRISNINAFVANNFSDWHRRMKITPVFLPMSKAEAELRTELKRCDDDIVKALFNKKNGVLMEIYALQHPMRHFLLNLLIGVVIFAVGLVLFPVVLLYIFFLLIRIIGESLASATNSITEICSYFSDRVTKPIKVLSSSWSKGFYMEQTL